MTDEKKAKLNSLAKSLTYATHPDATYDMLVATLLDAKYRTERPTQYDNAKTHWREWSSGVCPTFWAQIQILTRDYHEQNMLVLLWCRQELGC